MPSSDCTTVLDVCFARFSQLTAAGAPITGLHGYVSDQAQKVTVGITVNAGTKFTQKNGCGALVGAIQEADVISGATFSMDLATWERDLLALTCGGTRFINGAHTAGWQVPRIADAAPLPVCVELWAKAIDGSAQAVTATTTPNPAYHVFVMPYVLCTFQPFTLANGFTTFTVNGVGSENNSETANGPFNDWPSWVAGHNGITAVIGEFETAVIPTAACGLTSVPTGS